MCSCCRSLHAQICHTAHHYEVLAQCYCPEPPPLLQPLALGENGIARPFWTAKALYPDNTGLAMSTAMQAQVFDSKFAEAHDTWNSVGVASDGTVYYIVSCERADVAGRMYAFSPSTQAVKCLGDLTEICGDAAGLIPQGKSHVVLVEDPSTGEIHFSTHVGHYAPVSLDGVETEMVTDGVEHLGGVVVPLPEGRGLYPGGCYVKYAPASGAFTVLGRAPDHQGIISSVCDFGRGSFFCLLFPSGKFGYLLPGEATITALDFPGRGTGEAEHPARGEYRLICRAPVVDPTTGKVYFTNTLGQVLCFDPATITAGVTVTLEGVEGLHRDYLSGVSKPTEPGNAGFHWRQVPKYIY